LIKGGYTRWQQRRRK